MGCFTSSYRLYWVLYFCFLYLIYLTLTAIWVIRSQVEEAVLASVTALTFHILFADTLTAEGITHTAVTRSGGVTVTC